MTIACSQELQSALEQEFRELGEGEFGEGAEGEGFLGALSGLGSLASGLGKVGSVVGSIGKVGSGLGKLGRLGGVGRLGSEAGSLGRLGGRAGSLGRLGSPAGRVSRLGGMGGGASKLGRSLNLGRLPRAGGARGLTRSFDRAGAAARPGAFRKLASVSGSLGKVARRTPLRVPWAEQAWPEKEALFKGWRLSHGTSREFAP